MTCAIPPLDQSATHVGRGYGMGWNRAHTHADQLHGGMDLIADAGSPILAPVPGRVLFVSLDEGERISAEAAMGGALGQVRRMGGYGNCVVLEHDFDVPGLPRPFWTSYNHMQSPPVVSAGQVVRTGDLLGYVGNTTNGQFAGMGSHLHMEVRTAAFPGVAGHDGYELDTVNPGVLFEGLGIDWVEHHREVERDVGGRLLIRAGGPSDCAPGVSGLRGRRGLGVVPAGYIDPERIKGKYTSKGRSSALAVGDVAPPDYKVAVNLAKRGGSIALWQQWWFMPALGLSALVVILLLARRRA